MLSGRSLPSVVSTQLGRRVFGAAVVVSGIVTLLWRDYNGSHQALIVYASAAAQILGGAAMAFDRTAKPGAVIVFVNYLFFALLCVPPIVAGPQTYNNWGNFFEQFSLASGAAIVYASASLWAARAVGRMGRILIGICTASFGIEQAVYANATASLVPKWVPPSQMFWAMATTAAFALAAVALLTDWWALLAARLLTAMLVAFGALVWIPLLLANPHSHTNWSETAETFAIAGAAWILADVLVRSRRRPV
jgi:hypothetical protein